MSPRSFWPEWSCRDVIVPRVPPFPLTFLLDTTSFSCCFRVFRCSETPVPERGPPHSTPTDSTPSRDGTQGPGRREVDEGGSRDGRRRRRGSRGPGRATRGSGVTPDWEGSRVGDGGRTGVSETGPGLRPDGVLSLHVLRVVSRLPAPRTSVRFHPSSRVRGLVSDVRLERPRLYR